MKIFRYDIKNPVLFKKILLKDDGMKYMCSIISELLNLDYEDLLENIKIYSIKYYSASYIKKMKTKTFFTDVIYEYKNKLFFIEMNKTFSEKLISKNYYYLLFRYVYDATIENGFNRDREMYLIDIDNFDIVDKMDLDIEKSFIYKPLSKLENKEFSLFKNIQTYRINLDYLKNKYDNCDKLTNIERDCLFFIENDKEILRENIKNKYLEGVIKKMEVAEMDEKFYPLYDRENLEMSLREEAKTSGREETKKEIVKNMYDKKYTLEQIADVVKISLVDIKYILKDRIN